MIVEDDPDILSLLGDSCRLSGFEVSLKRNGQEALNALVEGARPDLILLDLMMPVMNGWEFLKVIKNRVEHSKIPVIVISASRMGLQDSQIVDFVKKPVSLDDLNRVITQSLNK